MCFVVPSGKIHPKKKPFLTAFSHHFTPRMQSWQHPELNLRSCHCYWEGDHLQRNAVAKSELLSLILRQPKSAVSLLLVGDRSTRISQVHEDLPANPPTPQTKNINKKNRHWNLKPWSPPNKKKERRFFKSNQTTQFLSGPRAVFHLEAVDLTHVFCPWMVCVCVFCTPSAPKKKTQTQANPLFTGCQASEVVVVRVGGLQRDWIATCSFFIQLFVTLILWWNFGVFLFEKNVLSPLKTHHGKRLHERVMLEKNLKGMYSKACENHASLDKKNLPVARSWAVGVVFIVNLPCFSPCKDPFRSSISDPECFNVDLVH